MKAASGFEKMPDLVAFFSSSFGPRWAVTGSVALRLHAEKLGKTDVLQQRRATDVDVVLDGDPRTQLPHALNAAGLGSPVSYSAQDKQAPASFDFADDLKVDVMSPDAKRWGLVANAVSVAGIPVMSLSDLKMSKQLAIEASQDTGSGSGSDSGLVLERNKRDLELIEELQSAEASATGSTATHASNARKRPRLSDKAG